MRSAAWILIGLASAVLLMVLARWTESETSPRLDSRGARLSALAPDMATSASVRVARTEIEHHSWMDRPRLDFGLVRLFLSGPHLASSNILLRHVRLNGSDREVAPGDIVELEELLDRYRPQSRRMMTEYDSAVREDVEQLVRSGLAARTEEPGPGESYITLSGTRYCLRQFAFLPSADAIFARSRSWNVDFMVAVITWFQLRGYCQDGDLLRDCLDAAGRYTGREDRQGDPWGR